MCERKAAARSLSKVFSSEGPVFSLRHQGAGSSFENSRRQTRSISHQSLARSPGAFPGVYKPMNDQSPVRSAEIPAFPGTIPERQVQADTPQDRKFLLSLAHKLRDNET